MKYALDTNVVARLLDKTMLVSRVVSRRLLADSLGMPLVALAELLLGVEKCAWREQNRDRLLRFAAGLSSLALRAVSESLVYITVFEVRSAFRTRGWAGFRTYPHAPPHVLALSCSSN